MKRRAYTARMLPDRPTAEPCLHGVPLKSLLRRTERLRKLGAFGLVLVPLLFILVTLVLPISAMLWSSVSDPVLANSLPRLSAEIRLWQGRDQPPYEVVAALVADLIVAERERKVGRVAARLNHEIPGFRTLMLTTADRVSALNRAIGEDQLFDKDRLLARLIALDARWAESRYWIRMRQAAPPYTMIYLLRTIDRTIDLDDEIVMVKEDRRLFVDVFWRTVWICFWVTVYCLTLGYPIAFLLANMSTTKSNICLLFLLLPLWTSILVKSLSWLVALQNEGVVNDLGILSGLWSTPFELARNRVGTYVSMVHMLLPFMTFPLFSVMKGIDGYHMQAAATMGANLWVAFWRVYFPQTLPGVGGGVLLVFILSLGLYVPPALVGGPGDQMLSYFIAWGGAGGGLAASLSIVLLGLVALFLIGFHRVVGVDRTLFR